MIDRILLERSGLNFILDNLRTSTSMGRKAVIGMDFMTDVVAIEKELSRLGEFSEFLIKEDLFEEIQDALKKFKDIAGSLRKLDNREVLDDIELFEIKDFSLSIEDFIPLMEKAPKAFELVSMSDVVKLLDPEGCRIRSFYIYDSYSEELKMLRKDRRAKETMEVIKGKEPVHGELADLRVREKELEYNIRKSLSNRLAGFAEAMMKNLSSIAQIDLSLAKFFLARDYGLNKPSVGEGSLEYRGLFNPEIKEALSLGEKSFQSLNIYVSRGVSVITGANMSGKTVLLKTICLSQVLFQMGFYVPAESAVITPVEKVLIVSGDYQNSLKGLSSFAAEMIELNKACDISKEGKTGLLLFDEPARNTNPHEGSAIVKGIVEYFSKEQSFTLISTHYDGIVEGNEAKRFRSAGLKLKKLGYGKQLTPEDLGEYVDYSIIEIEENEEVPREALVVAELLGLNKKVLASARKILEERGGSID